jgi:hypothetical protein
MTHTERHRLTRLLNYNKGFQDALLWIQNDQPYDEEIELKLDIILHKIEQIENRLKNDK